MLISLHLPKTAGSSFRKSLENHFGNENVLIDHKDFPLHSNYQKRELKALLHFFKLFLFRKRYGDLKCIHGHFLPFKYLPFRFFLKKDIFFLTWIRNPVDRLVSHYNYWIRAYNSRKSFGLHKRVVEEKWSLEKFCLSKEMRDMYSQYLWKFPLKKFDFIGVTEFYDEDMEYLSKNVFKSEIPIYKKRAGIRDSSYKLLTNDFKKKVERFHDKDMRLYKEALKIRKKRIT